MELSPADVLKIANLAKLHIEEDDIPDYVTNLSKILEFVEQLNGAPIENIKPMAHPLDVMQRTRADNAVAVTTTKATQANAPEVENGLYLVPQVIE